MAGQQEALNFLDAVLGGQQFELVLRLDALDDDAEAELRAQPRDAAQQVTRRRPRQARAGTTGRFHLLQREAVQVAEAGIAGAEIIERERDAELGKLMQVGARSLRVQEQVNSVISISSRCDGRFVAASVSRTSAGTLERSNWLDETLTATAVSPGQRRHSRQAL